MKNFSLHLVVAMFFVWGLLVFALVSTKTSAPTIQTKTVIAPVPVKIVTPTNASEG